MQKLKLKLRNPETQQARNETAEVEAQPFWSLKSLNKGSLASLLNIREIFAGFELKLNYCRAYATSTRHSSPSPKTPANAACGIPL